MKKTKKIPEQLLAESITNSIHDVRFDFNILANLLVNNNSLYAQNQIMELITAIVNQQSRKFFTEWENGNTCEGLLIASHLSEVIRVHQDPDLNLEEL
jgi:hypothetical protein